MMLHTDITGLVLAGGLGRRMGGVDKGLQPYHGTPLALHALRRLQGQVGSCLINANRNLLAYAAFGAPVVADTLADYPGPLAGFVSGLSHCRTPWLLTVPCDSPCFPLDLASRMRATAQTTQADIVLAAGPERHLDGQWELHAQPVFALLRVDLLNDLLMFTRSGGRKIDRWTARHRQALCAFDQPGDDVRAFANANTLDELHALEQQP